MTDHQKRHVHNSRFKRVWRWAGWTGVVAIIAVVVVIWAWKDPIVQNRIQASFGNNAVYQKKEYDKQKALAREKYGTKAVAADTKKKPQKGAADNKKTASGQASVSSTSSSHENGSSSTTKYTYYTVKSGDFLSTIAAQHNTTVEELVSLNHLDNNAISAGAQIKVPVSDNAGSGTAESSSAQNGTTGQ